VYPNPASHQVTVSMPVPLPRSAAWVLYDQLGREVASAEMSAGQLKVEVAVGHVPPGLYFWGVGSEGRKVGSGKLIISK
jgi:Secretion system C-terminal sorting domain